MTDKVNISSIVPSQFPEFVREDYTTFVAFVKAYYEFLQQDYNDDLRTIRDIDTTLDEYIKYFKSEYAHNIPFVLANDRLVLSNIKDLNLAKGSEASYRLLFRLLFDKEISIEYPSQQMLRASDGRWEQKVSIFVGKINGNPDNIVNKVVQINTSSGVIKTIVHNYKDLQINIDGNAVYELSIDRRYFGNIEIGDRVLFGESFTARVVPTISKINITQSGKNFKVGEIYNIGTTGTVLKITDVDNDGSILFAQIIQYDMDTEFTGDFIYQLISKTDLAKQLAVSNFTIVSPGALANKDVGLQDATSGYLEFGSLNKFTYNIDSDPAGEAFPHNYAGPLLRTFSTSNIISTIDISLLAIIKFEIGSVSKYPGYYTTNNGFLDDAMYIQDSRFYQAYSYILRVDEKLDTYKAAVRTMIHPAGTALFGEYTIANEFDLSTDLESMIKSLIIILRDFIAATAAKDHFDVSKSLATTLGVPIELHALHLNKSLTGDFASIADLSIPNFNVGKYFQDILVPVESEDHFVNKLLTEILNPQIDNSTKLFGKIFNGNDLVSLADDTLVYLNGSALYYKYDTEVMLDSGGQIWMNNYLDDMTLFVNDGGNDYMVGKTTF